jgi:hypothetical protein
LQQSYRTHIAPRGSGTQNPTWMCPYTLLIHVKSTCRDRGHQTPDWFPCSCLVSARLVGGLWFCLSGRWCILPYRLSQCKSLRSNSSYPHKQPSNCSFCTVPPWRI